MDTVLSTFCWLSSSSFHIFRPTHILSSVTWPLPEVSVVAMAVTRRRLLNMVLLTYLSSTFKCRKHSVVNVCINWWGKVVVVGASINCHAFKLTFRLTDLWWEITFCVFFISTFTVVIAIRSITHPVQRIVPPMCMIVDVENCLLGVFQIQVEIQPSRCEKSGLYSNGLE